MTSESTATAVRQFVLKNFPLARRQRVTDDASLLESGIVDSTGVLELVGFIQTEFDVTVSDEELLPENFESISRMATFVERKKSGSR